MGYRRIERPIWCGEGTAATCLAAVLATFLATTCYNHHNIICLYTGYIREEYATIKIELGLMHCVIIEPMVEAESIPQLALGYPPNLGAIGVVKLK